jgi:hypothetical protein
VLAYGLPNSSISNSKMIRISALKKTVKKTLSSPTHSAFMLTYPILHYTLLRYVWHHTILLLQDHWNTDTVDVTVVHEGKRISDGELSI